MKFLSVALLLVSSFAFAGNYPSDWWREVPRDQGNRWEILPQEAGKGEVILSKRTELGIFSNLGAADFEFEGVEYASVEGLWQKLKYPDPKDRKDPRHKLTYPYTREEVSRLSMWESKRAGDLANAINKAAGIKFVSYRGKRFDYKDMAEGSQFHYKLIRGAMEAKVFQNENIKDLLLKTRGLILKPDHKIKSSKPPAYKYHDIYMEIRSNL
ncbi:MAG: hypothetical protein CME70_03615 [Halobacteriovorax sp.]|nr:hypothetical protein [Halobacteriovorax sp.]|tara:strand:+ start:201615 stop:202250 length:636 start_codon:yes stop_codon:yes gene_type:complete